MKRIEKIALLTQALKGNTTKLSTLKQDQAKKPVLFLIDEAPKGWFSNDMENVSVKTTYSADDETYVVEYLTRTQMRAKTKGVITIIPDNHRRTKIDPQR